MTSKQKKKDMSIACMLNTEIGAVLAVLRRWPSYTAEIGMIGPQPPEQDAMMSYQDLSGIQQSLKSLRTLIFSPHHREWRCVDPSIYLCPFLDIIQSDEMPAVATMVCLSAILKVLKIGIFDEKTPGAKDAINGIVVAITSCRLEKSNTMVEEAILMKILQVLLILEKLTYYIIQVIAATMNHAASILLSDEAVCTIVNTCFNVLQQSANRGDLLKRTANYTMHEIVRTVYSRLPEIEMEEFGHGEDGDYDEDYDADDSSLDSGYGIRCGVDIFQFLCSLLNVVEAHVEPDGFVAQRTDEEVQLFALVLMNTALELSGDVIEKHPKLLRMIQDDLFHHLIHYGTKGSALVLSMICSTVLNLYHFLRRCIRLQLEAFFVFVLFRVAAAGTSPPLLEVALEGIINFCRSPTFLIEAYVNYDCVYICGNVFQEIGRLLCRQAFPTGGPLTSLQTQAFEGLLIVIHTIADNVDRDGNSSSSFEPYSIEIKKYSSSPFWEEATVDEDNLGASVEVLRLKKAQKNKVSIAGTHFNLDDTKGFEYLKYSNLVLRDPPDATAIAYFFRYTPRLDKTVIGDYLGDPDEFHLRVLKEFTNTFDFFGMALDSGLRSYLETFKLPGESQKIHRILEAFSERFFDQQASPVFETKDAVFTMCYSVIMLNTDQHNPQVKKKMTEEEFIRNNRAINNGRDLPREYLSELFQSIAINAITLSGHMGPYDINPNRWIELMNRAKLVNPFVVCNFEHRLGRDMFATIAGPAVSTLCAIFEHTEEDDILNESIEGLISIARIAQYGLEDILDELVASLCKFTTLLNPYASIEETLYIFANDLKPRMATLAVFTIANNFGESIRGSWRNIVDCLLKLKRLKLLPQSVVEQPAEPSTSSSDQLTHTRSGSGNVVVAGPEPKVPKRRHNSSIIGRFSHFLSTEGGGEDSLVLGGSEFEQNLKVIQQCEIGKIFNKSSVLPEEALHNLGRSLIFAAAGKGQKFTTGIEEEETVNFCWDLVLTIGLANINRLAIFWPAYYEYMLMVAQFPMFSPGPFAEKGIFVIFKICVRLLSSYQCDKYPEELIFKSINLMWKFDKEILDTCCDLIIQSVSKIINEYPDHVQTPLGWKSLLHLLSVTGRHPEAYDLGVDTLINLLSDEPRMTRTNYAYCIDCAFGFVALKNSPLDKNLKILDLMVNSVNLLIKWYKNFSDPGSSVSTSSSCEENLKFGNFTLSLFVKVGEALRKTSLARREEIRNQAVFALKKCFMLAEELDLASTNCISCFNCIIFAMVDDLHEKMIEYSRRENAVKEMKSMENTLKYAMELLTDVFLKYLRPISDSPAFRTFWLGLLRRMDTCVKADLGDHGPSKMQEIVPELLKRIIAEMKETDILVPRENDDLWEITSHEVSSLPTASNKP